jgi:ornithine cyclodeaminase/alanine dehydrogenase-like protein (mu-crystallin family)
VTSLSILYLSDDDIIACGLTHEDVTRAVEAAFRAKGSGRAWAFHKLSGPGAGQASFTAKGGALLDAGFAAAKWYGYVGGNAKLGLPDFSPVVVLNAIDTGMPVAIMDGRWISAVRTASITAAAAAILARPESASVGFVACGAQAQAHLETLRARFRIARIVAYSRRLESAERLAALARRHGIEAQAVTDPTLAVTGLDIVVTSVPRLSEPTRFLDASLVSAGSFVSMVDLGYAWNAETLGAFDCMVTDDFEAGTRHPGKAENLNYNGTYHAELGEILAEPDRWRADKTSRRALLFAGSGIADVAAAAAIYARAVERQIGRRLPI